jgi:hypothetical protein
LITAVENTQRKEWKGYEIQLKGTAAQDFGLSVFLPIIPYLVLDYNPKIFSNISAKTNLFLKPLNPMNWEPRGTVFDEKTGGRKSREILPLNNLNLIVFMYL